MDFFRGLLLDGCNGGNFFCRFQVYSKEIILSSTSIAKSNFSCAVSATCAVAAAEAGATINFVSTIGGLQIILEILLSLGILGVFA